MRAKNRSGFLAGAVMLLAIVLVASGGMAAVAQDGAHVAGSDPSRPTPGEKWDRKTVVLEGAQPQGFRGTSIEPPRDSMSEERRAEIQTRIVRNVHTLELQGRLLPRSPQAVSLGWPLRSSGRGTTGAAYGTHAVSGYVDHDPAYPDQLLDWACGTRTYDLADGYNHRGTDYATWPFPWLSMDEDALEVAAAAPGTIIEKRDGNYDRNCGLGDAPWNAVYVLHGDGSVAWYGHLKKGSLTSKGVGDTVAAGEHLGIVGSSGSSTGPHLHFELWRGTTLVDPYHGDCNALPSWWASQRPYYDSAVNMVTTGDAIPETPACPNPEVPHIKDSFASGQTIYFSVFYRDHVPGQQSQYTVYRPDGTIYSRWTRDGPDAFSPGRWNTYWLEFHAGLPAGTWRFEVEFQGQIYRTYFNFKDLAFINVQAPAGGENWLRGTTATVRWTDNLGGNVRIDLYKGGAYHSVIAPSTASDGSHAWQVAQGLALASDYRVRVTNQTNPTLFAQSAAFSVVGTGPAVVAAYLPLAVRNYAAAWQTVVRQDFEGSVPWSLDRGRQPTRGGRVQVGQTELPGPCGYLQWLGGGRRGQRGGAFLWKQLHQRCKQLHDVWPL